MFLNGWDPEYHMQTHLYVMVINNKRQGHLFSKYGRLKLCRSASNVPTNRFTEYHQLRPETGNGIDWM